MTTMTVMPRDTNDWTVDDLKDLPDDGLRYELLDGLLLVSPAPTPLHQDVIHELVRVLDAAVPDELRVYFAPVDWQPDQRTSFQPDVLVVPRSDVGAKHISGSLLLTVEVLSPSTRRKDQLLKFSKYADAGVASYCIVDPDDPSIIAYDLIDGNYVKVAQATGAGSVTVKRPFTVTVIPESLISG